LQQSRGRLWKSIAMSNPEKEESLKSQQLYVWKAPLTMCLSMMGGVGFAVGHHCFYRSLAGKPLSPETYHAFGAVGSMTSQQVNIALGTLLASMSKILLSIAVSTAQEQHAWRALKARPSKLISIDGLLTSKSNVLSIVDTRLWLRYPLSMLLSLLFWLLPFAPLLTPATLTVKAVVARNVIIGSVPSVSFNGGALARFATYPDRATYYLGPTDGVRKAAVGSLVSGMIIQMAPVYRNASWSLNFEGPVLQCSALGVHDELRISVTESALAVARDSGHCYQYISWMPASTTDLSPFQPKVIGFEERTSAIRGAVSGPKDAPISIFVAENEYNETTCDGSSFDFSSFTRCTLYSASYYTKFNYQSGVQEINTVTTVNKPSDPWVQGIGPLSKETPSTIKYNIGVSFQAVMDAFSSMLNGSAQIDRNVQGQQVIETQVGITPLAKSLGFYRDQFSDQTEGGRPIPTLIEEMFRNVTLSLLSQTELNPAEPVQANIKTHLHQNIYIYSVAALWIGYGIAVGIAILSIAVGTWAVAAAGSSYSSKFSTILRLAFNVHLSEYLELRDTGGEDPLPNRLENTIVLFPPQHAQAAEVGGSLLGNREEQPQGP
ncbi:hypothetical protein CI238_00572, partial [Colletotrichum incanum]